VCVVKLHGDAAHPDEVVLSRDDYDEFFARRPALALLLEGLLLNRTFSSPAYSLRDPNFRQSTAVLPACCATHAGRRSPRRSRPWRRSRLSAEAMGPEASGLIGVPARRGEQQLEFLRFLDGLADRVMLAALASFSPTMSRCPRCCRLAQHFE